MKNVLAIAFHCPPAAMGSGHLRTLALMRYLPEFGWRPLVLSAQPRAYPQTAAIQPGDMPNSAHVTRAFALDAKRHLGIRGTYPLLLAQPDRWGCWWFDALRRGLSLIRRHRPALIWSTYPIATAHWIGLTLHRLTGIPWVADFRDPVTSQFGLNARTTGWIERRTLARSSMNVFTTASAAQRYAKRFPTRGRRIAVIPNGYDEYSFEGLTADQSRNGDSSQRRSAPVELVHSGVLYPDGRNPAAFFKALQQLKSQGRLDAGRVHVTLRASGHEQTFGQQLDELDIGDMVSFAPPLDYRDGLGEQMRADGLLLFQGQTYNAHIPAKVYEYFRAGKPIVALVDADGDTARLLRDEGIDTQAPLDDTARIRNLLDRVLTAFETGQPLPTLSPQRIATYSRRSLVKTYAEVLDNAAQARTPATPADHGPA